MRKTNLEDINIEEMRELGYERSDVSLPTLIRWIIFLFIFVAFCSLVSWVIYRVFVPEIGEDMRANAQKLVRTVPGDPQLQVDPKRDIREFRLGEERVLDTYGWADKAAGTVHIPIDRAMATIAERGLPSREAGPIPGAAVQPSPNVEGGLMRSPSETGSTLPPNQPNLPPNQTPSAGENPSVPQGPETGGEATQQDGRQPGDQPGSAGTARNHPGNSAGSAQPNPSIPLGPGGQPR
jgi:hypothetical protein